MRYIAVGLNISSASPRVLGGIAFSPHALPAAHERLLLDAAAGVIVSTCNRTEIYGIDNNDLDLEDKYRRFLHVAATEKIPDDSIYCLRGIDAVTHLFRVAAGLESVAIGETQAVGQVLRSLRTAGSVGVVAFEVSRLFHAAIKTSRRVHSKTGLGRRSVSVASLGIKLLTDRLQMNTARVLLLGAGETGRLAALALKRAGVQDISVASRRRHKAESLAAELGGTVRDFSARGEALSNGDIDILVCCTAATQPVVSDTDLQRAVGNTGIRVLDLAMPPDVPPSARDIEGVLLVSMENLQKEAARAKQTNNTGTAAAEAIVRDGILRFKDSYSTMEIEPTIKALAEKFEDLRRHELERTLQHLSNLSPEEVERIEVMTKVLVKRILATPIANLKATDGTIDASTLSAMFGAEAITSARK